MSETNKPTFTEPGNNRGEKQKLQNDLLRLAGVAVFFIAVAYVLQTPYVRSRLFDINRLREDLQALSFFGIIVFIFASAIINAIGLPRMWICAIAGSLYGAFEGTGYGFIATLLGASLNFLMGRSLLRGPIRRRMPNRLKKWYEAFNRNGFKAILYLRLFPFTNATVTNLLSGASKISFKHYLLASAIGFFPTSVALATLGSSAAKNSWLQLALGIGVLIIAGGAQWYYSKIKKQDIEKQPNN